MSQVTTTTAAAIIPEIWEAEVEYAAHNARGFSGKILEYNFTGPGDVLHIPKIGAISAAAFTGSVSYTANTEGSVDITPDVSYAAVQIDRKANIRAVTDLGNVYQVEMGKSLAQYEDVAIAGLYAGLSGSISSGTAITEAIYLQAIATLMTSAKDKLMLGTTPVYGVIHPGQWDNILIIGNINSAMVRGDAGAGPAKTGVVQMAYGVELSFSSSVILSTTYKNMFFGQRAFAIARKMTSTVDVLFDPDTLSTKVVASQDFGVAELNDELGVVCLSN